MSSVLQPVAGVSLRSAWPSCRGVAVLRLVVRHFPQVLLRARGWVGLYIALDLSSEFRMIETQQGFSHLPPGLFLDLEWKVLSITVAEQGVLVSFANFCETVCALFKCSHCLRCTGAAQTTAFVVGTCVRIVEDGHVCRGSQGFLATRDPWTVRLNDFSSVRVAGEASLRLDVKWRLCPHFVGQERAGFWGKQSTSPFSRARFAQSSSAHTLVEKPAERSSCQEVDLDWGSPPLVLADEVVKWSLCQKSRLDCANSTVVASDDVAKFGGTPLTHGFDADWASPPHVDANDVGRWLTPVPKRRRRRRRRRHRLRGASNLGIQDELAIDEFGELMDQLACMQCGEI